MKPENSEGGTVGLDALVGRLRAHAVVHDSHCPHDEEQLRWAEDLRDAADKIERLRAAASQASFCLRELLPNDPDAQVTVSMLHNALGRPDAELSRVAAKE
ncbi:MAG: hypothetical protein QJR02_11435 [Sinobacteraceae bacterium]|nr:hypothetical protein [Nevskiaceae bacterium]